MLDLHYLTRLTDHLRRKGLAVLSGATRRKVCVKYFACAQRHHRVVEVLKFLDLVSSRQLPDVAHLAAADHIHEGAVELRSFR